MADAPTSTNPTSPNRPEFEIEVDDGRGLLLLRPRLFFGWLPLDKLELLIPKVQFPLDIRGGLAQFQSQRCVAHRAEIVLDKRVLEQLIALRAPILHAAGFSEIEAEVDGTEVRLAALVRRGETAVPLFVVLEAALDGRDHSRLRWQMVSAYALGFVRRPALLLGRDLVAALVEATPATPASTAAADDDERVDAPIEESGLAISMRPLHWLLRRLLPEFGWRMPELADAGIELEAERVTTPDVGQRLVLRYAAPEQTPGLNAAGMVTTAGEPAGAAPAANEGMALGDRLLVDGDLAAAAVEYRRVWTTLGPRGDGAATVVMRLLGVLVARDGSLREAERLLDELETDARHRLDVGLGRAQVAEARGRLPDAAVALEGASRAALDQGERLLARRAVLAAARLLTEIDPQAALRLFERVLELSPGHAEATRELFALYRAQRRFEELAALHERVLSSTVALLPLEEAALRASLAELLFNQLTQAEEAEGELLRVQKLAGDAFAEWDLLARIRVHCSNLPGAIAALHALAEKTPPEARAAVHERAAEIEERIGNLDAALADYRAALALGTADPGLKERAAELAVRAGRRDEAIVLLQGLTGATLDGTRRARVEGRLFEQLVLAGRASQALALHATMHTPPSPKMLLALAAQLEGSAPHAALGLYTQALEAKVSDVPEGARPAATLSRGRLALQLGRLDEADEALRGLARGTDAVALDATGLMAELACARGDGADERRWLEIRLQGAAPTVTQLLRRLELALDDGDRELATALVASATMRRNTGDVVPATRLLRLQARTLGLSGRPSEEGALLAQLARDTGSDSERLELLIRAAHCFVKADDLPRAAELVVELGVLAPADLRVRSLDAEVAFARRSWDVAADRYTKLVTLLPVGERGAARLRAATALQRIGRVPDAERQLEDGIHEAVTAERAVLRARLGELYLERGQPEAAAAALVASAEDEASHASGVERADLLVRAAELWLRRLGAPERAATLLEQAIGWAPGHIRAWSTLESLWAEAGQTEKLLAALLQTGQRLALAPDAAVRKKWLERVVGLEPLWGTLPDAVQLYEAALGMAPSFRPSLRALAARALGTDQPATATPLLEALAEAPVDLPDSADSDAAVERRVARILLARLAEDGQRFDVAEEHLWAATELVDVKAQPVLLAEIERIHRRTRRWADLSVVLTHHQSLVDDPVIQRELEVERVRLLVEELDELSAAAEAVRAAMARFGRDPRLMRLALACARAMGDGAVYAAQLKELLADEHDPSVRSELLVEGTSAALLPAELTRALEDELLALPLSATDLTRAALAVVEPRVGFILADRAVVAAESEPDAVRIEALRAAVQRAVEVGEPDAERAYRARLAQLGVPEDTAPAAPSPPFTALPVEDVTAPDVRVPVVAPVREPAPEPADSDDAPAQWSSEAVGEWLDQSRLPNEESSAPDLRAALPPTPTDAAAPHEPQKVDALVRMMAPPAVAAPHKSERQAERQRLETAVRARPRDRQVLTALIEIELTDQRWLEAATYLDQLARLVDEPAERAELLYRQATLLLDQLGEPDGWSVLLRAVDLYTRHAPTLRRLVDYYWDAAEQQSVLEMADLLAVAGALDVPETGSRTRARICLWGALDPPAHGKQAVAVALSVPAVVLVEAAVDLLQRTHDSRAATPTAVADALRALHSHDQASLRSALSARGDATSQRLATLLK